MRTPKRLCSSHSVRRVAVFIYLNLIALGCPASDATPEVSRTADVYTAEETSVTDIPYVLSQGGMSVVLAIGVSGRWDVIARERNTPAGFTADESGGLGQEIREGKVLACASKMPAYAPS